jgi:hypothetical protein
MYTRRPKESHRDTVTYEIDMLDFCARRASRECPEEADKGVYLEGFLLHYHNLVRFFSGEHHREDKVALYRKESRPFFFPETTMAPAMSRLVLIIKTEPLTSQP